MDLDEGMPASRPSDADLSPAQRYAKKIDRLTHFASTLLSSHGELEIYDETYEQIIKTLKAEGAVRRDWVPPVDPDIEREEAEAAAHAKAEADAASAARGASSGRSRVVIARPGAGAPAAAPPTGPQYFYKWNSPPPGQPPDQEYGPYDRATFEQWVAGGYFGEDASRITVRKDGEQNWASWKDLR
jgi:CD2 antigen cytoplasmic tail-binding protein 2